MASTLKIKPGNVGALVQPASRAFMLGYLLDALPTILKQVLRYVLITIRDITRTRRRIAQERRANNSPVAEFSSSLRLSTSDTNGNETTEATTITDNLASRTSLLHDGVLPALRQLPLLLRTILKTLLVSLGPKGVAFICALAMTSTTLMDALLSSILLRNESLTAATKNRRKALSTFISAAISSSFALFVIQRDAIGDHKALQGNRLGISNPFKRKQGKLIVPTPLAPGGHFLARLTSLSVPATPGANDRGSRSPIERSSSRLAAPLSPTDEKHPSRQSTSSPTPSATATAAPDELHREEELGSASPTIDLSLFALVRAMDTFVRVAPLLFAAQRVNLKGTALGPAAGMKIGATGRSANVGRAGNGKALPSRALHAIASFGQSQAEGLTFVVACAVIMFNWFYHPERLPPTYVKWISNLASMDHRLLEALRCLRMEKPFKYGYGRKDTPPAGIDLLGSLAESMGHPYGWGDISRLPNTRAEAQSMKRKGDAAAAAAGADGRTDAPASEYILHGASGPRGKGNMGGVPCELIHCGVGGASCFKNALYRFLRAWRVCLGIYFPVHLLPRLIFGPAQFKREPVKAIAKVLQGSMRSATFLSTFIASIWFMVCMARTVVLPRLFPNVSFQYWDSGLGPIIGSWTCGWSVFIEEKRKRAEMALYVAPRALFALAEMAKPGWLSRGQKSALQTERIVFGASVGVVLAAAKHRPDLLRGLTALIAWVVAAPSAKQTSKNSLSVAPRSSS